MMATAAAARARWAALGRQKRAPAPARDDDATGSARVVQLAAFLLVLFAGALIVCAVAGFAMTQRNDGRSTAERRALRLALDELHATFGDLERFDEPQLRLIERRAGLKDLQFGADPAVTVDREVQSLHDGEGRIIGWFSWAADRALVPVMDRLWLVVAITGAGLAVSAILAARAARRLSVALARSAETVRKLTNEDRLTGLPNQRAMVAALNAALMARHAGSVVLALLDLDAFREINDTLGRGGGDAVLLSVAEQLRTGLPPGAILGRFEEDAFAVIASSHDSHAAMVLAETIRLALARPIFVERTWQVTAGIGVAQVPEDAATVDGLIQRARLALRAAKRDGRNAARRFEPQIEVAHADRRFLLRELESAIALQGFDVHYQPVVAADGGAIVGVEALLRWTHPTRGAIAPSTFIPLAEQNGLMSKLGELVLRRALADGARWPNLTVAVNLSPLQIRDRWLVDLVGAVMAETGIASSRVVLEVTEGILIDNPQEALKRLEALRALGVSIALDDFGTGYSSLSYLQKFPFDRLKIDRTFVASLGTTANTGAIIQSIVTLGHALGMTVLAEGIETDEQRVLLRLAGCDEMQGFLFAKPAPAAEIDRLLKRAPPPAGRRRS